MVHHWKKISPDEQMRYKKLDEEKARRDEISRISYAEKIGIKEGIKEGEEELIRIMLSKGLGVEKVAELTDQEVSRIAQIAIAPESPYSSKIDDDESVS